MATVPIVAGLPVGPATAEQLRKVLFSGVQGDDQGDDDLIDAAVNATNDYVLNRTRRGGEAKADGLAEVADGAATWDWPELLKWGANTLAARWYSRRSTPDGLADYGEVVTFVQRNDPDVALALGLGANADPVVG